MVDGRLSVEAYELLGHHGRNGLAVAIATKADAALYELSDAQQVIARRILLRLVQFGEGRADTRRQLPVAALESQGDDSRAFDHTLRHLTKNRLITISGEVKQLDKTIKARDFVKVDIAHEVLITSWPTLQEWLSDLREAEQIRRRLGNKVDEWKRLGRGADGLLDRAGLSEAEGWIQGINASILGYDEALLELVEASRKAIEEIEQERIARATAEATQKRLEFLAEASKLLVSSLDLEVTLTSIAEFAVPYLADGCAIDLVSDDGSVRRAAVALSDAVKQVPSVDLESGYFPELNVFDQGLPTDQSQVVPDVREALFATTAHNYEQLKRLHTLGVKSFLIAPLPARDRMLGAIVLIMLEQDRLYSSNDLTLAEDLASRIALTVDNARLFQERGRQIKELATFNEIGQELSAASRYDELIELLYRQTSRLLDTTNFYIVLYDERRGEINFPLQYLHGKRTHVEPLPLGDSPTAYVIRTREPLLLQGAQRQADISERGLAPVGDASLSWLGVPMIAADRVIGVIGIEDYERDNAYSQDDIRLLGTIAAWGAIGLENARLLGESRQSVQELTALHEISVALTGTFDTNEILETTASSGLELMRADVCALFLLDKQGEVSQQIILDNEDPAMTTRTVEIAANGMTRRLLATDRPLVFNNIAAEVEESALGTQLGLRSALGAVIGTHEQPVGVIWLGARRPHTWHEREISLLSILTNQCGQALESARLFQSEQTRRRVADTLREVAQTLTSVLKPDEITALILDQLARLVSYDTASLMLREDNIVSIVATRGFDERLRPQIEQFSVALENDANLAQIVQTRQPLVLNDTQDSPYRTQLKGMEHCHGWIGVPLLVDNEVIGLLTVDSSNVGMYDEEDGQLAFALASQAAHALRNARLVEQQQQYAAELQRRVAERTAALADANTQLSAEKERFQAIHEITVELTENLDLEETLTKALGLASRTVGVKRGSIMLRNPRTGTLSCRVVLTADGTVESTNIPISFAQGSGLAGWVLSQEQGIYIGDVRNDQRWLREEGRADEVRSVIAVPLITKDEPLGVLILFSPKINYFGEAQLQLLNTIANEITIVIHNAELYSYINDLASQLAEMYEQQREETSKSQAILQSMTEGVIVLDEQQRVVIFNPAAEQVLGIPASFVLRQPLAHLKEYQEPESSIRRAELIHTVLHEGLRVLDERDGPRHTMLKLPAPDQSISINFATVIRSDGVYYGSVAVLRDVTREIG